MSLRLIVPRDDLDTHEMLRFALVRAIEIIGEAASRVSPTKPWFPHPLPTGRLHPTSSDISSEPWFPYRLPTGRLVL